MVVREAQGTHQAGRSCEDQKNRRFYGETIGVAAAVDAQGPGPVNPRSRDRASKARSPPAREEGSAERRRHNVASVLGYYGDAARKVRVHEADRARLIARRDRCDDVVLAVSTRRGGARGTLQQATTSGWPSRRGIRLRSTNWRLAAREPSRPLSRPRCKRRVERRRSVAAARLRSTSELNEVGGQACEREGADAVTAGESADDPDGAHRTGHALLRGIL